MKKMKFLISLVLILSFVCQFGCSGKNGQWVDLQEDFEQPDSVGTVSFDRVSVNETTLYGTEQKFVVRFEEEYGDAELSGLVAVDEYVKTGPQGTLYRAHMVAVYKNTKGLDVSEPFNLVLHATKNFSEEGYVLPAGQDIFLYNLYEIRDNAYKNYLGDDKPEGTVCLTSTFEGGIPTLELFRADGQLYLVQLGESEGESKYADVLAPAAVDGEELDRVSEAFKAFDPVAYGRGVQAAFRYGDAEKIIKKIGD